MSREIVDSYVSGHRGGLFAASRAEGGTCGKRGSGIGGGADAVLSHASAGVWPSSA